MHLFYSIHLDNCHTTYKMYKSLIHFSIPGQSQVAERNCTGNYKKSLGVLYKSYCLSHDVFKAEILPQENLLSLQWPHSS